LNNSRTETIRARVPTSQRAGAKLELLFDARATEKQTLTADAGGRVALTLAPLQFALWRADAPLGDASAPAIALSTLNDGETLSFSTREIDGSGFPTRQEIRADVQGGDGFAEVTFTLKRASRPDQIEYLGTDDAPPYRIFWSPPPDLAADDELTFVATMNDLRGHVAAEEVTRVKIAPTRILFGIRGATVPRLTSTPPARVALGDAKSVSLVVHAEGTPPLEYQWLRNDEEISGATGETFTATTTGAYRALVRNRAGTTLSFVTRVDAPVAATASAPRIEKHRDFPSQFVAPREVDVWLPPGYDRDSAERYPVIYAHDGQNLFDPKTSYAGVPWSVDEALLRLIAAGKTRGAIVVGIWNTPARSAEYMPQKAVAVRSAKEVAGLVYAPDVPLQSDAYLRFVVTELKPFVDRTYRTATDRAHTFIMGSSMGGLISAYAIAEFPEVFGGAACVSTHWPAGDGAVIDYLARHLPPPGAHKFYFDYGTATLDAGYEPFPQRMEAAMRAAGSTEGSLWLTRKFPGAAHAEQSWRERVDIPLAFLLGESRPVASQARP